MKHKGFTVTLEYEFPYGIGSVFHPIAIGVTKEVAHTIYKHYNNLVTKQDLYNDWDGVGYHVMMTSREYCTNHTDFERETMLRPDSGVEYPFNDTSIVFETENDMNEFMEKNSDLEWNILSQSRGIFV